MKLMFIIVTMLLFTSAMATSYSIQVTDLNNNPLNSPSTFKDLESAEKFLFSLGSTTVLFEKSHTRWVSDLPLSPILPADLNSHTSVQCWDRSGVNITYRSCTTETILASGKIPEHIRYEIPPQYKLAITDITSELTAKEADKLAKKLAYDSLMEKLKVEDLKTEEVNQLLRSIYL